MIKRIWILWYQGWNDKDIPEVILKCANSWEEKNPSWQIVFLEKKNIGNWIDLESEIPEIYEKDITLTSLSDIIRIFLLKKYGGVWVDSTTYCIKPLDLWLNELIANGVFLYTLNKPGRMISSWFIASEIDNYCIEKWYQKTIQYWRSKEKVETYFWFHNLFGEIYRSDSQFKSLWDKVPIKSASGPHYFLPYPVKLFSKVNPKVKSDILNSSVELYKLTYKGVIYEEDSTLNWLFNEYSKLNPIL